jgi:hypothetical protein
MLFSSRLRSGEVRLDCDEDDDDLSMPITPLARA